MFRFITSAAVASIIALAPTLGHAKGCLKGAAVGGVAGHLAGGHGVVGAAAGCAIEHHREKAADKKDAKAAATPGGSQQTSVPAK